MIGGSAIVAPTGEIAAQALSEDDEVITTTLDLDLGDYLRRTVFNFEKHRRIEHYGLITEPHRREDGGVEFGFRPDTPPGSGRHPPAVFLPRRTAAKCHDNSE